MSDDGIRWCKRQRSEHNEAASYTLLPIYQRRDDDSSKCSESSSLTPKRNFRQHHRYRINRDISNVRRSCSDNDSEQICNQTCTYTSSLKLRRRSYRLLNICLMLTLHLICNGSVTSVNCDDLLESVGARGHFTHTWAAHIPGGVEVAEKVAADHGMYMRGEVSDVFTYQPNLTDELHIRE